MRTTLYRAWHIKAQQMFVVKGMEFNNDGVRRILMFGSVPSTRTSAGLRRAPTQYALASSVELMEYTGVDDKNGVRIFEGDIIRKNDMFEGVKNIGIIYYEKPSFLIDGVDASLYTNGDFEVIGNIYENSELVPISLQEEAYNDEIRNINEAL